MSILVGSVLAGSFLALPFIIWGVFRFFDKVMHKFFSWSKLVVLLSFLIFWTIAIIVIVVTILYGHN